MRDKKGKRVGDTDEKDIAAADRDRPALWASRWDGEGQAALYR